MLVGHLHAYYRLVVTPGSVTSQQSACGQAQVPSLLPLHLDGAVTASMPRGGVRDQRFYVGLGLPASFKFFPEDSLAK